MRVSVAMCTYNGEKYLQEQLHSILQQSRQPDELVVCEDASSDATLNILETFKQLAPFEVRIYANDSNLGYVKNFEQAISRCNGEIILCSDQDDIWYRDRVERSVAVFRDNPDCGYVFSDAGLIDGDGEQIRDTLWGRIKFTPELWRTFQDTESQAAILYPRHCVTGATLAFRAMYREKLFPIPRLNIVIHDGWVAVILSLNGCYGIALKEPLIFYRSHSWQSLGAERTSFLQKLPKIFFDPREEVNDIIFDLSVIQSHISDAGNPSAMTRVERTFGQLMSQLNTRLQLLNMSSRLRRIIPILQLYRSGGYAYCTSHRLSALRDMIFRVTTT
jgi:glycosyltransferase involved in cell wall biosynthesis